MAKLMRGTCHSRSDKDREQPRHLHHLWGPSDCNRGFQRRMQAPTVLRPRAWTTPSSFWTARDDGSQALMTHSSLVCWTALLSPPAVAASTDVHGVVSYCDIAGAH